MKLSDAAQSQVWVFGLVMDEADVTQQAINAARHFLGWGRIAALDGEVQYENPDDPLFAPRTIPWLGPSSDLPDVIYAGDVDFGVQPRVVVPPPPPPPVIPTLDQVSGDTDVSASEWSLIRPLFQLFVERENARALEASRIQGVDVYGRTVSEIQSDIERYENGELARLAFFQPVETI